MNETIQIHPGPTPPMRDDRIEQAIDIAMMLAEGDPTRTMLLQKAATAWIVTMEARPLFVYNPEHRNPNVVRHYFKGDGNQCQECGHFREHDIHA